MKIQKALPALLLLAVVLSAAEGRAQQSSSAAAQNGEPRIVESTIEIGVRGVSVDGNATKYRSDLNYEPGFRVFNSSFLMQSNGVAGMPFDTLMVNSYGWGGDPNQYLRVNAEKGKWYRFDANYRQIDYFNSLANLALQQHVSNTEYKLGDFDLTLLPNNEKIRFNAGYSLSRQSGDSLTTFDYARDEFPVLSPVRVEANDFRVGAEGKVGVFDLSFQQGWRAYKEDTTYFIDELQRGNNPTNQSELRTFRRDFPMRGDTTYSRFSLHTNIKRRFDFTGRFIYQSSEMDFSFFETVTARDFSGNNVLLDQFTANGDAKRPHALGDIGATVFVTDRFRISNTFSIQSFRITGGFIENEILERTRANGAPLPITLVDSLVYRKTFFRRASNRIEGDFDIHPTRLTVRFGHRYTDRRIELDALDRDLSQPPPEPEELETFDNRTNTFLFGFRARPLKIWTLYFDMERGENDNVFTRVDNYDFTNFRVRSLFKPTGTLTINASLITRDNNNPAILEGMPPREFGVDINSRIFSASADWSPNSRFSLSPGYTYTHITSEAAIIFFFGVPPAPATRQEGISRYFMRDSYAFINLFVQPQSRVSVFANYNFHRDPGQGDRRETQSNQLFGSFPYQYQSPGVRVSVRLHNRLDWVAGYQYFDYKDNFRLPLPQTNLAQFSYIQTPQFYHAHLPFTSLRFYFGRNER